MFRLLVLLHLQKLNEWKGNAKIIGLISRDEALHMSGTQSILKILASGKDDPEFKDCMIAT